MEPSQTKRISRAVRFAAAIQMAALFGVWAILNERISNLAQILRDSLYDSGVATEEIDKVNQTFSSLTGDLIWILIIGIALFGIGSGVLIRVLTGIKPSGNGS